MADSVVVWVAKTELEMPCGRAQQADNNPQRGCREVVRDPTGGTLYFLAVNVSAEMGNYDDMFCVTAVVDYFCARVDAKP